jgi:3-hydroxyacyl-[acyl-carrier-protein] dehydratase
MRRTSWDKVAIQEILPHRDPFLFLDEAKEAPKGLIGSFLIPVDGFFVQGHFPGNPVFPAALLSESLGQLAVLHLLLSLECDTMPLRPLIYFTGSEEIRCHKICRPGMLLDLKVSLHLKRDPMAFYEGEIQCEGIRVLKVSRMRFCWDSTQC